MLLEQYKEVVTSLRHRYRAKKVINFDQNCTTLEHYHEALQTNRFGTRLLYPTPPPPLPFSTQTNFMSYKFAPQKSITPTSAVHWKVIYPHLIVRFLWKTPWTN